MCIRSLMACLAVLAAILAGSASAQQPVGRGGVQEGRRLALGKCDACHTVAADQLYPPLLAHYAPSFYDVANRPGMNVETLKGFLAHHHTYENMPYPDLTPSQVTDIVDYILSLRGRH
jgi:mono/diheme cytochrome c family protein